MYFHLYLKRGTEIFFYLDVIAETEDDKGIPSSTMPI